MGGDDKPAVPRFQSPQVVEIHHRLGRLRREIQQEHVLAADGALDSGDEHDIPFTSVRRQRRGVQLAIVQRDRQRGIPARRRAINQRARVVQNQIDGILGGMRVEVGFQHIRIVKKSAPRATKAPRRGRSLVRIGEKVRNSRVCLVTQAIGAPTQLVSQGRATTGSRCRERQSIYTAPRDRVERNRLPQGVRSADELGAEGSRPARIAR